MIVEIFFVVAIFSFLVFLFCVLIKVVIDLFYIIALYYLEVKICSKLKHPELFYSDNDFLLQIKASRHKSKRKYITSLYIS